RRVHAVGRILDAYAHPDGAERSRRALCARAHHTVDGPTLAYDPAGVASRRVEHRLDVSTGSDVEPKFLFTGHQLSQLERHLGVALDAFVPSDHLLVVDDER